jgi:hypothetical protein
MPNDIKQSPNFELELEIYKILAALFNAEEAVFWTRNNVLVVVQAGLIAAATAIAAAALKDLASAECVNPAPIIGAALLLGGVSLLGLAMSIAWALMVKRGELVANSIESKLKDIEFFWQKNRRLANDFFVFNSFGLQLSGKHQTSARDSTQSVKKQNRSKIDTDGYPKTYCLNRTPISNIWFYTGIGLAAAWCIALLAIAVSSAGFAGYIAGRPLCENSRASASGHTVDHAGIAKAIMAASAATSEASSAKAVAIQALSIAESTSSHYQFCCQTSCCPTWGNRTCTPRAAIPIRPSSAPRACIPASSSR